MTNPRFHLGSRNPWPSRKDYTIDCSSMEFVHLKILTKTLTRSILYSLSDFAGEQHVNSFFRCKKICGFVVVTHPLRSNLTNYT